MIRALYTSVTSMIAAENKQNIINNNIANVNTTGFKGDDLITKSFDEHMVYNFDGGKNGDPKRVNLGKLSLGTQIEEDYTSFKGGVLSQTGTQTDFGIEGEGFFVVRRQTAEGQKEFYTRDGGFHVDYRGFLVNSSNDLVMGKNNSTGNEEPIYVGRDKITADNNGNVVIGDGNKSFKLKTVNFLSNDENPLNLNDAVVKMQDNLFSLKENGKYRIDQNPNTVVRQGFIEKSNVNIISEMVNMMTNMRIFESNQKMIQTIDESLGKAANEVGNVR